MPVLLTDHGDHAAPEPDVVEMTTGPLADVDIALLLAMGVPAKAITPERTLDRHLLAEQGWRFDPSGSLSPPDTEEFRQLAEAEGERIEADLRANRKHHSD